MRIMKPSEEYIERQTYEYALSDFTNNGDYAYLDIFIPNLTEKDIVIATFSFDSVSSLSGDEANYFKILKNGAFIDTTRSENYNNVTVYINPEILTTVPDTARIWVEVVIFYRQSYKSPKRGFFFLAKNLCQLSKILYHLCKLNVKI